LILGNPGDSIIKLFSLYPDYVFVVRFDWTLEAYDISQNERLWTLPAGRGSVDVFYDHPTKTAYITSRTEPMRAIAVETGKINWREDKNSLYSAFEDNMIYTVVDKSNGNSYRLSGFNVENQTEVWSRGTSFSTYVYNLAIVGDLLIVCGDKGLLAVDKSSGDDVWHILSDEEFQAKPIEFDDLIYAKSTDLVVYAIDPANGDITGFVKLEEPSAFSQPMFEILSGVYKLEDGILVNTRHAAIIYEPK
jgi:outer membrane protein assembly factor BamB